MFENENTLDDSDSFVYLRRYDQNFGFCLGLLEPSRGPNHKDTIEISNHSYKTFIDVGMFQPNEIKVSIDGRCLVIEGNHGDREDCFGSISRNFVRRHTIPDDVDVKRVIYRLSDEGVLIVRAPLKTAQNLTDLSHTSV